MLAQGFLCLGKSTLPEFGFNATTEPAHDVPTRNPWNLAYSTGASSGGSAALVAAGVVTRSVRDTANFLEQAEAFYRNPELPAGGRIEGPSGRPLKIGLILDSINGHKTDDITRQTVEETARKLEKLGHRIEPVSVPVHSSFPDDFALYWALLAFGVKANGKKLIHPAFEKHRTDGLTNGLDTMFRKQFWRLPTALWRLKRSRHDYAHAMAGFDAVLTPVLGHTTPPLGDLSPEVPFDTLFERLRQYVSFTPLANATGAPAISIPMGRTPDQLPVSVQFMGRHGGERTLLDIAFTLEAEHPWPLLRDLIRQGHANDAAPRADSLTGTA
ncbi:amidase family protein [Marinobacter metalliresistant]|uniref:Amidase family protein n=1 Tax=Marinobacter metalliresistant TaxID=2961995 RepID=A0ABZ2W1I6_9GAMM